MEWRLASMEKRQEQFEAKFEQWRVEMAAGFSGLRTEIKDTRVLTKDVYEANRSADLARIASTERGMWWVFSIMMVTYLTALILGIVKVVTA